MRKFLYLLIIVFAFILFFLLTKNVFERDSNIYINRLSAEEIVGTTYMQSFSDSFSGTGWKNQEKSSVYHDFKTLSISFPPDYRVEDIVQMESIKTVKSNGREVVFLTENSGIIIFDKKQSFINLELEEIFGKTSKIAKLDYDAISDSWIITLFLDNNIVVYKLNIKDQSISKIISLSGSLFSEEISLNCLDSFCLIGNGERIWQFAVLENSKPEEIFLFVLDKELENNKIISFLSGKTSDKWLLGVVSEDKEDYKGFVYLCNLSFDNCQMIKTWNSEYSGSIYFGYSKENKEVLVVCSAYFGQAYLVSLADFSFIDYSHFFHQRIMEGTVRLNQENKRVFESRIKPNIFFQNNAWWISSFDENSFPRVLRISGKTATDLTDYLIEDNNYIYLVSGFLPNNIFAIKGKRNQEATFFQIQNLGFLKSNKVVWESSTINIKREDIAGVEIEKVIAEKEGGNIKYFVSNNGGKTWIGTEPEKEIWFKEINNDLRWKAELFSSRDQFKSPNITWIHLTYYYLLKDNN